MDPQHPTATIEDQLVDAGVHHVMILSSDVNLQTWQNQYGSTTKTVDQYATSTSINPDMSLHLPIPSTYGTAKIPRFPMCRIENNTIARDVLNYNIIDELA